MTKPEPREVDMQEADEHALALEEALLEYVERFGLTTKARKVLARSPHKDRQSINPISDLADDQ